MMKFVRELRLSEKLISTGKSSFDLLIDLKSAIIKYCTIVNER